MEIISSRSNLKIKQVRALQHRKGREEARLFFVEGIRHVGEAVEAGADIETVYYSPDLLRSDFAAELIEHLSNKNVPCYAVTADVFSSMAEKENPQGILAVVRQPDLRLEDFQPQNLPWGVALVSPQDPGNVGTILRVMDAVGASGLILLEDSVDPYHPGAVRASMGSIFWIPVLHSNFESFQAWAKRNAYMIYGSSAKSDCDYLAVRPYRMPRILLLGSERQGLTEEQKQACDIVVRVPMRGRASSLNLAVAAGILLYAMLDKSSEDTDRKNPPPI